MAYALVHAGLTAALFLGFWATGWGLGRAGRAPVDGTRAPALVTTAVGMIGWSAALFALAALDALRAPVLQAAVAAAGLAGAVLAARAALAARGRVLPRGTIGWREAAGGACVAVALVAAFLLSLDPHLEWDADSYHLTLPRIFLEQGGFVRIPFFVYSTWPLATEMLYALALSIRDHVLAAGVHFGCGALLVIGVAGVARRAAGSAAAVLAAVLLLVDPAFGFEIRTAYVDLALALYFFLAYCAWEPAADCRDPRRRRALLALAGVLLGGAAGTKLVGGLAIAVFAALELARSLVRRRAPGPALGDLACLLVPALALAAPWYARSFALTGDPLYPALHPLLGGGGGEWSADLAARTAAHHRAFGMGRTPVDFLLLPLRLTGIGSPEAALRFAGTIHPVWPLLLPIVVWGCFVDRRVRGLALPALLWTAGWFAGSQTVRLLLPAQPFLACAAAVSSARVAAALAPRRPGALATVALAAAAALAASSVYGAAPRVSELFALASRGEAALLDSAIPPHCRFVNDELPRDARILMLDDNRSFFCRRAFLADSLFQASQIDALLRTTSDSAGLAALLERLGVTHVLAARRDWGIAWPPHLREALRSGALLRPVYRDGDVAIYAVSSGGPSPARGARRTRP